MVINVFTTNTKKIGCRLIGNRFFCIRVYSYFLQWLWSAVVKVLRG